jgi:hypothetical protein
MKPASINLRKLVVSPTGSINLSFILREDLLLYLSYLPLGVSNWVPNVHYHYTLFFHRRTRNVYGMVHLAYRLVMDCIPWVPWTGTFCCC